jgi:hypothetical protein
VLVVKWQRKLGPPKADESSYDQFARARVLEAYEKLYQASAKPLSQSQNRKAVGSGKKASNPSSNRVFGTSTREFCRDQGTRKPNGGTDVITPKDRYCYFYMETALRSLRHRDVPRHLVLLL